MPRRTYRRSRPKDMTWVTFGYYGKLDGTPLGFEIIGDDPGFLLTTGATDKGLFNRPVLLRATYVSGTAKDTYSSNLGDTALIIGVGFATPTPDMTIANQPKRFPLVLPAVPYARDSTSTYYHIEGGSKAMRKIERGYSVAVAGQHTNDTFSGIEACQLVIRCLFEVS